MYDERRRMGELMAAFEDGEQKGRAEGREEGREAAKIEDAKKLKELGVSIDVIAKATGLSVETIIDL